MGTDTNIRLGRNRGFHQRLRRARRAGAILVFFALLLVVLLGMVGLVVDLGLMMGAHRQAQNAADAAALAVARGILYGVSSADAANATAAAYVKTHNGLTDATFEVNIPPANPASHYLNAAGYVEVEVTNPVHTFFIQVLPGVGAVHDVFARAVAGSENVTAGEGVAVLDPSRTGLTVGGNGILQIDGHVFVNSEGGGVDANGVEVFPGTKLTYKAAEAAGNILVQAAEYHIVGGVNTPTPFQCIDPNGEDFLLTGQPPIFDPLINLPTPVADGVIVPKTAPGVVKKDRGNARVLANNVQIEDPSGENCEVTNTPNTQYYVPDFPADIKYLRLNPGIYMQIAINSGYTFFTPGIYVIRPDPSGQQKQAGLSVTGGAIIGRGIMIYNTGHNYNPDTGAPDVNDGETPPPGVEGVFANITLNSDVVFEPIDKVKYAADYTTDVSAFNGMLFYQRRRNSTGLTITGNSENSTLAGTLYAKWAPVKIVGQGVYQAQFVVGSMDIQGNGTIRLQYAGSNVGMAPQVFLVE